MISAFKIDRDVKSLYAYIMKLNPPISGSEVAVTAAGCT